MRFTGLCAFPLTPLLPGLKTPGRAGFAVDEAAYGTLIERLANSRVDSIGALGSTGSYAYLSRAERARVAELAVQSAGTVPVVIGVSALSTREVLANVDDAQRAGASAVLLTPMSYQRLTEEEVFGLYERVAAELSVPVVVYDNPATTGFTFTAGLHGRISELPGVASIKIPPVPTSPDAASAAVAHYREHIPTNVTLGVSGDGSAAAGLIAGCDAWYSVLAGVLPRECLDLTRAAQSGDHATAAAISHRFAPLWDLFAAHGSLRVVAAVAEELGLTGPDALPHPVRGLDGVGRRAVAAALDTAGVSRG
ncbi:dihydrodipicolinate synthase family protein [Leucobacter aridicollis]|uniref:dihydrodipicolinate synthase family protein n=1 Tax=Leucobacter aridicollis TaxID=283878 RepID=UPI00216A8028|nr:dihydrodipicolinate synthase family protein [Leucobacter aridicollis]MCS3426630.1 4-hydroxy-tetrahydrodipicolinate synthase [Leucobacter aridicollis]